MSNILTSSVYSQPCKYLKEHIVSLTNNDIKHRITSE